MKNKSKQKYRKKSNNCLTTLGETDVEVKVNRAGNDGTENTARRTKNMIIVMLTKNDPENVLGIGLLPRIVVPQNGLGTVLVGTVPETVTRAVLGSNRGTDPGTDPQGLVLHPLRVPPMILRIPAATATVVATKTIEIKNETRIVKGETVAREISTTMTMTTTTTTMMTVITVPETVKSNKSTTAEEVVVREVVTAGNTGVETPKKVNTEKYNTNG